LKLTVLIEWFTKGTATGELMATSLVKLHLGLEALVQASVSRTGRGNGHATGSGVS
jgi:hypothetical protein